MKTRKAILRLALALLLVSPHAGGFRAGGFPGST